MAKKALCIGINNYPGTDMDLGGCVNDAEDWSAVLAQRGFAVQRLIDAQATKAAMVASIRGLVKGAAAGDSLVITYSGHGTYAPDQNGDEPDGLDEGLCPYDIEQGQVLIDDEIHQLFADRAAGVRVVLISDSCHSGTVIRAARADPDAVGARPRFLPMGAWLPEEKLPRAANGQPANQVALTTTLSPWAGAILRAGGDLLLSGCADGPNNFSYDATIAGRPNGAFSYYALKALKTLPADATYADWHAAIRQSLPSASYPQTPQLFGSKAARKVKVFA
ncbi:MAG: caspase family protein [Rhodocyclaceae bacterium]